MKLSKIFTFPIIITFGIYPLTMNSADIFERAKGDGKIVASMNQHIIPQDSTLDSTILIIATKKEYHSAEIFSKCENKQKILLKDKVNGYFIYTISFSYIGKCNDNVVYLKNGDEIYTDTAYLLPFESYSRFFIGSSDLSNEALRDKIDASGVESLKWESKIEELKTKNDISSKISLISLLYEKRFLQYQNVFLSNLQSTRNNLRYLAPIAGHIIPTKANIIPNAGRPYRANYTDGIHHGWDLFAKRGTPVQALSDGVVIRIKNGFNWNNFDKIKWKGLSFEDKLENLDIYRGNQIWLKTADGNVTIYSHLDHIPVDLKEEDFVKAGDILGKVDRTGVPDKEYKDFHLHFEIQMNPHLKSQNSYMDIMKWPFFGQGKSREWILSNQNRLFSASSLAKN